EQRKELRLRFRKEGKEADQAFIFRSRDDCQQWHEQLLRMKSDAASGTGQGPEVVPMIFLRGAPEPSCQPLGEVESQGGNGERARFELAVRAALKGADAVADLHEEPGQPPPPLGGTAVGAADAGPGGEVREKWCAGRVSQMGGTMLLLVVLSLVLALASSFFFFWLTRPGRGLPPYRGGPIAPLLLDMAGL